MIAFSNNGNDLLGKIGGSIKKNKGNQFMFCIKCFSIQLKKVLDNFPKEEEGVEDSHVLIDLNNLYKQKERGISFLSLICKEAEILYPHFFQELIANELIRLGGKKSYLLQSLGLIRSNICGGLEALIQGEEEDFFDKIGRKKLKMRSFFSEKSQAQQLPDNGSDRGEIKEFAKRFVLELKKNDFFKKVSSEILQCMLEKKDEIIKEIKEDLIECGELQNNISHNFFRLNDPKTESDEESSSEE